MALSVVTRGYLVGSVPLIITRGYTTTSFATAGIRYSVPVTQEQFDVPADRETASVHEDQELFTVKL